MLYVRGNFKTVTIDLAIHSDSPHARIRARKEILRVILDLRFTITLVKRSPGQYGNAHVLNYLLHTSDI
jgi:hypothetical protein